MGIGPPKLSDFRNQQTLDKWARSTPVVPDASSVGEDEIRDKGITEVKIDDTAVSTRTIANGAVTNAKLRNSNALSVIGRSVDSNGPPADIPFLSAGQLLMQRVNQLVADFLVDGDIPATIARVTDVTAALADYVPVADILDGSKTFDPSNLSDGAESKTDVTVTGAALGDFALGSFSLATLGLKVTAEVSAADTVTVHFHNRTGGAIDLGSGTVHARVWKL